MFGSFVDLIKITFLVPVLRNFMIPVRNSLHFVKAQTMSVRPKYDFNWHSFNNSL